MPSKSSPEGIRVRHSIYCPTHDGGECTKKRKSGKPCEPLYEAFVYDRATRSKVRQTFKDADAAKTWRVDALNAMRKGSFAAATKVTVREAAEAWLDGAKSKTVLSRNRRPYKPSAIRGYEADLNTYVLPDLGAIRMADLRRKDVQALVDRLVGKGLSGSKVRNAIMPLRAIVRHAITRDQLSANPTLNLELPALGARRERVATPAEAAKLLVELDEDDRALWATAFYGGLRRGELRALACIAVDLKHLRITVSRSWDEAEGFIEPKSEKGKRTVPIPGVLKTYLAEHLARTGRRGDDLIFGRTSSDPFTATAVRKRAIERWTEKKLNPIGLHEARHTYVSLMHAAGASLETIGDFVGHASTYMTDAYRHLMPDAGTIAADQLDAYLAKASAAVKKSSAR